MMTRKNKFPILMLAMAGIAGFADGATYVYEGFDYASTGFTDGDSASFGDGSQSGGLGLDNSWTTLVNNVEMEVRNEAMTFTDGGSNVLPTSGLSIRRSARSGTTNSSRTVSASAITALTGDNTTMWMSFLFEDEGFSGPDSSVMLASESLASSNDHSLSSAGFGVGILVGESSGNLVESGYYNNSTSTTRAQSSFAFGDAADALPDRENITFLLAAKIVWNPEGTPDEIFVFNITDITTEPAEVDALVSDTFDFTLLQQQSLNTLNIGETQVDAFDEIRFGTSFGDVMATNPIPEPGTLALFILGGMTLLRRRRG